MRGVIQHPRFGPVVRRLAATRLELDEGVGDGRSRPFRLVDHAVDDRRVGGPMDPEFERGTGPSVSRMKRREREQAKRARDADL